MFELLEYNENEVSENGCCAFGLLYSKSLEDELMNSKMNYVGPIGIPRGAIEKSGVIR